jgi:hypothetical protein
MKPFRFAAGTALALAMTTAVPALADAPCDGVYRSSGRACHGAAYVRGKTIEWNAQFSTCKPGPYRIIDSNLEGDDLHVAYEFLKRSRRCQYGVMVITGKRGGYWSIQGYQNADDYQHRRDDPVAYDSCPVNDPMPSSRCNLPFVREKK